MKATLKSMKLERVPAEKKKEYAGEERLLRILAYLKDHRTANSIDCMRVNQCSRYIALQDLHLLIEAEKVEKLGSGKNVLYMLRA